MKVTGEVIGTEAIAFKLQTLPDRMRKELHTAMDRITVQLVNYVQSNKLSGQVLHRRTGTLSRSIRGSVTDGSNAVTGVVDSRAGGGAPLPYAAFWEYGFQGTQSIRAHLRRSAAGKESMVSAHSRTVNQAARSFLRTSLAENKAMINTEVNAAIKQVVRE